MKQKLLTSLVAASALLGASQSHAIVIDFTGGTAYFVGGGSVVTDNILNHDNIDYYEEGGFRLDFIGNTTPFAANIGNYYGNGNAVIHGHWDTGNFGELTEIKVTKIGGGTFDLNYFILTSNTDTGGTVASGNERAFIRNNSGNAIMLPPQNWGFPAAQIFLPSSYDGITEFSFYVENAVDCFGMDEFFIDEPAPPSVPDAGSTAALLGLGVAGLAWLRRRVNA